MLFHRVTESTILLPIHVLIADNALLFVRSVQSVKANRFATVKVVISVATFSFNADVCVIFPMGQVDAGTDMKDIFARYKNAFRGFGLAVVAFSVLAVFSCAIVLPIWFFAENFPRGYTIVVSGVLYAVAVLFIVKQILKSMKHDKKKFLRAVVRFFTFVGFFILSVYALFFLSRATALLFFLAPFVIFFVIGILKPNSAKTDRV